ncbi:MAG: PCMD domain-containing protein [Parabacteroides sp.]
MRWRQFTYYLAFATLFSACLIEDDIPYPIRNGEILEFAVEGQCAAPGGQSADAVISKTDRMVTVTVNDSVDLKRLKITKLVVTEGAEIWPDSAACVDYAHFPRTGFASLEEVTSTAVTRMNFNKTVHFTLRTYQDYAWKINVTQFINRTIDVANQVGSAVIDEVNHNVVIYVAQEQSLSNLQVNQMDLGGAYGRVEPDPTTITDYSQPQQFYVKQGWEDVMTKWTVFVYNTSNTAGSSDAFAMVKRATITGTVQSGKTPVIEYKKPNESNWKQVAGSAVQVSGTNYTATLTGLTPATTYQYRISVDGQTGDEKSFQTAEAIALPNGSLDEWSTASDNAKLWQPWASGGTSFWDTGNKGATSVGDSNSTPTSETCNGSGKAACLESKFIVIKFAAGNIFTGTYKRTDGTNGVLDFGRPFTSFPSKLRVHYKYECKTIDKVGDDSVNYLKGRPDSCQVFIALTDWDQPLEIRTRPSERQLFDPGDPHVIAYGELIKGETVSNWTQADIELQYRYMNRTPKYIVIVACSSKYGDFFTGGTGSKLWLDECELIYE